MSSALVVHPFEDRSAAADALRPAMQAGDATTRRAVSGPGKLCGAVWCFYLVATPFYLLPSGMPQLADWFIVVLFGLVLLFGRLQLPRSVLPVIVAIMLFVVDVIAVNSTWAVILADWKAMLVISYYLFNLMACFAFVSMYSWLGVRFLNWTGLAVLASLSVQVVLYMAGFHGANGGRATIFFNNPNQLGFYAVLYGTLFWVWSRNVRLPWLVRFVLAPAAFLIVTYLSVISLSRAAVGAVAVMLFLACVKNLRLAVPLTALLAVAVSLGLATDQFDTLKRRFQRKQQAAAKELENRGYDRLLDHPEYLFLGAGESGLWRFRSLEFHSSWGTFLFCYGMLGLLLFAHVPWSMARLCGIGSLLYLAPILCYCATHVGHRQTEFWILLVMTTCLLHGRKVGLRPKTVTIALAYSTADEAGRRLTPAAYPNDWPETGPGTT